MTLKHEIAAWNGKSSADIRAVYDRYEYQPSFLTDLIDYARSAQLQKGATWLIKRFAETTDGIEKGVAQQILGVIPKLEGWEAKLHILQCLPHIPIPASRRKIVESFTRTCILDENKFVRAWSYGGFYELARYFPQYRQEAERIMEMGLVDEPASVQARIRKAQAQGFL